MIQEAAKRTGHLRLLVRGNGHVDGVVHVRDSLRGGSDVTAADLMRPAVTLDVSVPVYEALAMMRDTRSHLCTVTESGRVTGLIALDDVLERLLQSSGKAS